MVEDERGPWAGRSRAASALLLLTVVAGGLDATAFLFMGGTFVSCQTGTILLLATTVSGASTVNTAAALTSFVAFVLGAAVAGRLVPPIEEGRTWPARTGLAVSAEAALIAVAALAAWGWDPAAAVLVAPVAFAMGIQAAVARRVGLTYLSAGYITGSSTSAAMSSPGGDGSNRWWWYGFVPIAVMAVGAAGTAAIADRSLPGALATMAVVVGMALLVNRSDRLG